MTIAPQSGDTPQAGQTPAQSPPAGDPQTIPATPQAGSDDTETMSLAEARKLRQESRVLRERIKALDEAETARTQAAMTELEKLRARADESEATHAQLATQLQEERVGRAIERMATQLGIIDADAAAKLLDWSEIEYAEDGTPKNIEKLLKALIVARPYLASQPTTPPQGPASQAPMNPPRSRTIPGGAPAQWKPGDPRPSLSSVWDPNRPKQ